jgi:hypothetical protein
VPSWNKRSSVSLLAWTSSNDLSRNRDAWPETENGCQPFVSFSRVISRSAILPFLFPTIHPLFGGVLHFSIVLGVILEILRSFLPISVGSHAVVELRAWVKIPIFFRTEKLHRYG